MKKYAMVFNCYNFVYRLVNKYIRLTPFDVSTPEYREKERYRLAALASITNLVSKAVTAGVMVVMVSMTTVYLGEERFGLWMTIASLAGVLAFMNLGAANALTNRVTYIAANNEREQLKRVISGGLGFVFLISMASIGILLSVVSLMPVTDLFKLETEVAKLELKATLYIFAILFGVNLFASAVCRVFAGLQRSFEEYIAAIIGSLLALIAIVLAAYSKQGISVLLVCSMMAPIITGLVLLARLAKKRLFSITRIGFATRYEYKKIIKSSGLFFILQIGVMVGWGMDALLISSTLGAAATAGYVLVQRVFQIGIQPISMVNAPLWSAYADAHVRGEKSFIRRTLWRSIRYTLIYASIVAILIMVVGQYVIAVWTSGEIRVDATLIIAFGIWAIIEALSNALAMFLNGCNVIRQQVIAVIVLCFLALPIKIYLLVHYGVAWMIVGFSVTFVLTFVILYGFLFRKDLLTRLW